MKLTERLFGAWDVLRGLKKATAVGRDDGNARRVGSDPSVSDEELLSSSFAFYRHYTHLEPDRISVYSDMDEMFQYVLAHAALEAYIEDATQTDVSKGMTLWPVSKSAEIQTELNRLFEVLEIEDRISGDMWGIGKYGDHFLYNRYEVGKGIFDAIPVDPRIIERVESNSRILKGFEIGDFSTDRDNDSVTTLNPWDMSHFRIIGKRPTDKYGTPFFIQVRIIYKVLKLMEEQMTIYRMNMHPDRLVYKVFTGAAGPDERRRIVRQWRRESNKIASFNHDTGRFTSEYAPHMMNQDIFWPVGSNDTVSGVDKFSGSSNSGDIFDVEYMRDLFFAGVRVPKGYLGFEDSQGYRGTDTLSAQSIKFARGVKKLQRHTFQGIMRLCKIHLSLKGKDPSDLKNHFSIEGSPVSYLDEAHRAELYAKRFEAMDFMLGIGAKMAESFSNRFNSKSWSVYILREFGQFDDGMIHRFLSGEPKQDDHVTTYEPSPSFDVDLQLSEDEHKKLLDQFDKNPDISKALANLATVDFNFQNKVSSSSDRLVLPKKMKIEGDKSDDSKLEKIMEMNDSLPKKISTANKKKMADEFRDIVRFARQQGE